MIDKLDWVAVMLQAHMERAAEMAESQEELGRQADYERGKAHGAAAAMRWTEAMIRELLEDLETDNG